MANTEKEVKNIIKGILTSTPLACTIRSVEKDYLEFVGRTMPFHSFNYNSVEHFLRSMPDICQVKGTGPTAQCLPVITEKSSHINEMVLKQRVPTKKNKYRAPVRKNSGFTFMNNSYRNNNFPSSYQQIQHQHLKRSNRTTSSACARNISNSYQDDLNLSNVKNAATHSDQVPVKDLIINDQNFPSPSQDQHKYNNSRNISNSCESNFSMSSINNATHNDHVPIKDLIIYDQNSPSSSQQNYQSRNRTATTPNSRNFTNSYKGDFSMSNINNITHNAEVLVKNLITNDQKSPSPSQQNHHKYKDGSNRATSTPNSRNISNSYKDDFSMSNIKNAENSPSSSQQNQHTYKDSGNKEMSVQNSRNSNSYNNDFNGPNSIHNTEISFKDLIIRDGPETVTNIPRNVQNNLKILIDQFEDGIWCCDLPKYYRALFKANIVYFEYGYSSLIEMCVSLTHIFHYTRPEKDDFRLYSKNRPLPKSARRPCTISSFHNEKIIENKALPELKWLDFNGCIPEDVYEFGKEIPRAFLPDTAKEGDVIDVVVVEVYDPSKFWFYVGTSDQTTPLDELMDKMQTFYNSENQLTYKIPRELIKENMYCVQMIYGEYHRAKVVKVLSNCEVRVFFIDYGTVCRVPIEGMCFLHNDFSDLPSQAVRSRLANISPTSELDHWSSEATNHFRNLVNRKDTKIKISYINRDQEYVCVFLADITDANVKYINEQMIIDGHAKWDTEERTEQLFLLPNVNCKVQKLHLFPTFLELEYGLAPNTGEMNTFEDLLIPIQYSLPQYFEKNKQIPYETQDIHLIEKSFIETIKNNRKHTPLSRSAAYSFVKEKPIDFDCFGSLKNRIMQFYSLISPEEEDDYINSTNEAESVFDLPYKLPSKIPSFNNSEHNIFDSPEEFYPETESCSASVLSSGTALDIIDSLDNHVQSENEESVESKGNSTNPFSSWFKTRCDDSTELLDMKSEKANNSPDVEIRNRNNPFLYDIDDETPVDTSCSCLNSQNGDGDKRNLGSIEFYRNNSYSDSNKAVTEEMPYFYNMSTQNQYGINPQLPSNVQINPNLTRSTLRPPPGYSPIVTCYQLQDVPRVPIQSYPQWSNGNNMPVYNSYVRIFPLWPYNMQNINSPIPGNPHHP